MKKQNKGFTLVELLIVIVIIGILAAIIIPSVSSAIDKANFASDQSDAKNMNTTLLAYCTTNGIDHTQLEAPEVRSIVSSEDKNYTFVPKSKDGVFWYNTAKGEIEVLQGAPTAATSKVGVKVYAADDIDSIEEIVNGYLYLNTQGELANWLRSLRNLMDMDTYNALETKDFNAGEFNAYGERLGKIVDKYNPNETLFINTNGMYYSRVMISDKGEVITVKNVVFGSEIRVIPKMQYAGVKLDASTVIRLPSTVEVVLPGAFSGIETANKIEASNKVVFVEGALSDSMASANSISYKEIDKDVLKSANNLITITAGETVYTSNSEGYKDGDNTIDLFAFEEYEHRTVIALDKKGVVDGSFVINTTAFLTKYPNITTLSIQQFVKGDESVASHYVKEYHVQAFDSTGMVLNVVIVVIAR